MSYTPGARTTMERSPQVTAVREQGVRINATWPGNAGGLGDLAGGNRVVLNLKHQVLGIGHADRTTRRSQGQERCPW